MDRNVDWHSKNKLSENPTIDQSVKWHIEHAQNCPCPSLNGEMLNEIKKRYLNTHQEFWIFYNLCDHKNLALWAADCAEHILSLFEEKYPRDTRPRESIGVLREWVDIGKFSMTVIRAASLNAHAAARDVKKEDNSARFAARAAGQAVATAHVPTHALGAALYAIKAIAAANPVNVRAAIDKEQAWQYRCIPENLREWVVAGLKKNERFLRENLRSQSEKAG